MEVAKHMTFVGRMRYVCSLPKHIRTVLIQLLNESVLSITAYLALKQFSSFEVLISACSS